MVDRIGLPAGGLWIDKAPKGLQYKDKLATIEGINKVKFKTGIAGKTSVQFQGKGANVTLPGPVSGLAYFEQDPAITVTLVNTAGTCWTSNFAPVSTKKNEGDQFKAKAP